MRDQLGAALAAAMDAEIRIAMALALHRSDGAESPFCEGCLLAYPCPTVRVLNEVTP